MTVGRGSWVLLALCSLHGYVSGTSFIKATFHSTYGVREEGGHFLQAYPSGYVLDIAVGTALVLLAAAVFFQHRGVFVLYFFVNVVAFYIEIQQALGSSEGFYILGMPVIGAALVTIWFVPQFLMLFVASWIFWRRHQSLRSRIRSIVGALSAKNHKESTGGDVNP